MNRNEEWYIGEDGQAQGPFTLENLITKMRAGKLSTTDLVYHASEGWKEVSAVPEFDCVRREILSHTSHDTHKEDVHASSINQVPAGKPMMHKLVFVVIAALCIAAGLSALKGKIVKGNAKSVGPKKAIDVCDADTFVEENAQQTQNELLAQFVERATAQKELFLQRMVIEQRRIPEDPAQFILSSSYQTMCTDFVISVDFDTSTNDEQAVFNRAVIKLLTGSVDAALADFDSIEDTVQFPLLDQYRGLCFFYQKQYMQALPVLKKSLEAVPDNLELHLAYIESLQALERTDWILPYYKKLAEQQPENVLALYFAACFENNIKQACWDLQHCIAKDNAFAPAYYEQARKYYLSDQLQEARTAIDACRTQVPGSVTSCLLSAKIYSAAEDYSKAIRSAKAALALIDTDTTVRTLQAEVIIADAYLSAGKIPQAKQHVRSIAQQSTSKSASNESFYLVCSRIARYEGEFEKSLKILNDFSAADGQQENVIIRFELGLAYLESGAFEEAVATFAESSSLSNIVGLRAKFWHAVALFLNGDTENAQKLWHALATADKAVDAGKLIERTCARYLVDELSYHEIAEVFEQALPQNKAIIAFSVGLYNYNQKQLNKAHKYFKTAQKCLNKRRILPHYLVSSCLDQISKTLIVPD